MTVVVWLLAIVVAVLTLLVAGLLRSHALILRRLHELGAGIEDTPASAAPPPELQTPRPGPGPSGRRARDLAGESPDGGAVAVRVSDVDQDTVLLFLSSDCATCANFWETLAAGQMPLPPDTRLVVVTKGPDRESRAAVAAFDAPVPVVMSDDAWGDHDVPGSPYVLLVDGPSGRVRGEGTGATWDQVARLLARATDDLSFVGETTRRGSKARRDAQLERDTDAALLAAGLVPGDPSLYRRANGQPVDPEQAG